MNKILAILLLSLGSACAQPLLKNPAYVASLKAPPAAGGGGDAIGIVRSNEFRGTVEFPVVTGVTVTAGNAIFVGVWTPFGNVTCQSMTNTAGDTFTLCTGSRLSSDQNIEWWKCDSSAGMSSGNIGLDLTAVRDSQIVVIEVTGQAASSPFETAATGSVSAGTTITSASFSPASANNLNLVYAGQYNGTGGSWTAGANYALVINGAWYNSQVERRLSSPSGAQTAAISYASADDGVISVISIKD